MKAFFVSKSILNRYKGRLGKEELSWTDSCRHRVVSLFCEQIAQVQILLLLPSRCVSLDKIDNFSELHFLSLKWERQQYSPPNVAVRKTEDGVCEHPQQGAWFVVSTQ